MKSDKIINNRTSESVATSMSSLRKTSLVAGVLYLLTFVSIPTLALYSALRHPNYILGTGTETPVIIGSVLEIIVALACIGSAVALYPVLKNQNEGLAMGLVCSRVLEAGTIFAGVCFVLTVVTLRQTGAGTEALVISNTLVTLYDRVFLIGQSFMPAVNDIILGLLLYQSRLVPRSLAVIGLAGVLVLIVGDGSVLFGLIGQHAPITSLFAVPVAFFEFSLGSWLVAKGFNSPRVVEAPVQNLFKLAAGLKPELNP